MSPSAQRIAIAEACGWEPTPEGHFHPDNPTGQTSPDYLNDLNAMHEAEKVLAEFQLGKYGDQLQEISRLFLVRYIEGDLHANLPMLAKIAHSPAARRAEAFLRTIGKWEDGK